MGVEPERSTPMEVPEQPSCGNEGFDFFFASLMSFMQNLSDRIDDMGRVMEDLVMAITGSPNVRIERAE